MKNIIITAILSVVITIFCFHAYFVYQLRSVVLENQAKVNAVVDFIQKSIDSQKQASTSNIEN